MCETSTKVFVLEVMGRHAGWIAASGALAQEKIGDAPHIILFPEVPFVDADFLRTVNTKEEHDWLTKTFISYGNFWIDGEDKSSEGNSVWDNGTNENDRGDNR